MRAIAGAALLLILASGASGQDASVTADILAGKVLSADQMEALTTTQIMACLGIGHPFLFIANKNVGTLEQNTAYIGQKNTLNGAWSILKYGDQSNGPKPVYFQDVANGVNLWGAAFLFSKPKGGEVHWNQDPLQIKGGYIYVSANCR